MRRHLVSDLIALVCCLALALILLGAYVIGENDRCHRLTSSHSPSASYYCPQEHTR